MYLTNLFYRHTKKRAFKSLDHLILSLHIQTVYLSLWTQSADPNHFEAHIAFKGVVAHTRGTDFDHNDNIYMTTNDLWWPQEVKVGFNANNRYLLSPPLVDMSAKIWCQQSIFILLWILPKNYLAFKPFRKKNSVQFFSILYFRIYKYIFWFIFYLNTVIVYIYL